MIGSIIGAGLSAAGSIWGGIKATEAMNNYRSKILAQQKDNQDWYDRRYNEDATQRGDVQRLLTMTSDRIKKRNKAAAGTVAVMGSSTEAVAAEKEANNAAIADATSQVVAANEQRKDKIEEQYRKTKGDLDGQLANLELQKAQATSQAIQGVLGAAGGISGLDDLFGKKKQSENS